MLNFTNKEPHKMPSASPHAILECLKQKSLVDDKIKCRHGNREFFSEMWPPWGKNVRETQRKGMGAMKRELV